MAGSIPTETVANTAAGGYRQIVVAGAPRTGTHFIHALMCTSEQANPFAPEYHYFYFLLEAYLRSLKIFNAAECAGFASKEAFAEHHFGLMRASMTRAWEHLGRPATLVMKHCSFTPVLPVLARQFPAMRFVVIMRDARDAIASEVRAARKSRRDPQLVPLDLIDHAIARFNLYYGSVVRSGSGLGDRLLCVRYESLARGHGIDRIGAFLGFPDIDSSRLWQRATFDIGSYEDFKMHSALWGKPLSSAHIATYRETLPDTVSDRIFEETKRVMLRFESLLDDDAGLTAQPAIGECDVAQSV